MARLPVLASLVLALPLAAHAEPAIMTVGTHSMFMKDDPVYTGSRKFSFNVRSKFADPDHRVMVPPPGSDGDPTPTGSTGGGGVLVVYNSAGTGEQFTVPLPVEKWQWYGDDTDVRYVFASTPPVSKVYVKGHKVSIRGGKNSWGYTLDEPAQGRIAVRLTLGTSITWCSDAEPGTSGDPPSAAAYDRAGKFQARRLQVAPDACPPLP